VAQAAESVNGRSSVRESTEHESLYGTTLVNEQFLTLLVYFVVLKYDNHKRLA